MTDEFDMLFVQAVQKYITGCNLYLLLSLSFLVFIIHTSAAPTYSL